MCVDVFLPFFCLSHYSYYLFIWVTATADNSSWILRAKEIARKCDNIAISVEVGS
jgi:hypothetical protein